MTADPAPVFVAICIATCRRPAGIRALLASLDALRLHGAPPLRIAVILVDNAPDAPAFAGPEEVAALLRWPVAYLHEPRRGLVAARNRALRAVPPEADFVAFVDDDETVTPGWLAALLATQRATGAAAVQGVVVPRFAAPPARWMTDLAIYSLGPFDEGQALNFAGAGNVLLDARFLRAHRLMFDERFNTSGGEDEEFFGRLRALGGRIHASAGAIIHEDVPVSRMTLGWVLRRRYRMGNTLGRIALLRGRGRALRIAKGLGAVVLGLIGALALPVSRTAGMRGLLQAVRGAGMLAAFLRFRVDEYAPTDAVPGRGKAG